MIGLAKVEERPSGLQFIILYTLEEEGGFRAMAFDDEAERDQFYQLVVDSSGCIQRRSMVPRATGEQFNNDMIQLYGVRKYNQAGETVVYFKEAGWETG